METATFTTQDITDFLKQYVELGGTYIVDEDNVIHKESDNSIWCLPNNEKPPRMVKLVIYNADQKDPDVIFVNPFVEGLQTTDELVWFYTAKSYTVAAILRLILFKIIEESIKVKSGTEEDTTTPDTAKVISPYIDMIDDKMIAEIDLMTKKLHDFFNIFWHTKKHYCCLNVGPLETHFKESFGKRIRQKTWDFVTKVIVDMFGTDDIKNKYHYKSEHLGFAKFESFTQVLLMSLKAMQPFYCLISTKVKPLNLENFEKHLVMMPLYYTRAKHAVAPAITTNKSTTNATPPWMPVPISNPAIGVPITPACLDVPTPIGGACLPQSAQPVTPVMPTQQQYVQPQPVAPISVGHMAAAMQAQPVMPGMYAPAIAPMPNPMMQSPYFPQQAAVMPGMMAPVGFNPNLPPNPNVMSGQPFYPQYPQQMMCTPPQMQNMYQQPMYQSPMGMYDQWGRPIVSQQQQPMSQNVFGGATSGGMPIIMSTDARNNRAEYHPG